MTVGGISEKDLATFDRAFKGTAVRPGDPTYDEDRTIFNAMIDRKPALVAKCTDAGDVAAAIRLARDAGLPLSVRSGGHSVAGMSIADGGVVLDMRLMNAVAVDPAKRVATVGGGATWGDFDAATTQHSLSATGGRVSTTGVAGLTLGGGSGWTERKFGLACDNLRSVTLVTADGSTVKASDDENPDLFWALHGGGGNFGAAVSFEFNLHPMDPNILATLIMYEREQGAEVARNYRDYVATASEDLGGGCAYLTAPPAPFVPEDVQGRVVAGVVATWIGDHAEGAEALKPLTGFGKPLVNVQMPLPYVMFQSMLNDPPNMRNYWTAEYHDEASDELIDVLAKYGLTQKPSGTQLLLIPWGGAIARNTGNGPMTKRDVSWLTHPLTIWESADDDDFWLKWTKGAQAELKKFATGGTYLNFQGDEGEDRIVAAFGKDNYERLAEIKAQYDPDNVFRLNQNIKPRAAAGT
jgi:FAD/FMN-containing dehydrogenase